MNIVVIAAHPDDEVLGCGGTIAKLSRKHDVYVLVISEGASYQYRTDDKMVDLKMAESKEVKKLLKIKEYHYGMFPDMQLDTVPHIDINKFLEKHIKRIRPSIVFTHHWNDLNKDHRLVFESTMVACRPPMKCDVLCYETLSSTEFNPAGDVFRPNVWSILTYGQVYKKIQAMCIYSEELRPTPHPRSGYGIIAKANSRGTECVSDYAEAFQLVRRII